MNPLSPRTVVWRSRQGWTFHFDQGCTRVSINPKPRSKGTLGGCLAAGRKMCRTCGVDPTLLPAIHALTTDMVTGAPT